METIDLRKALHQYIDDGDDRLVKMMYAMVKEFNEEDDYEFTEGEVKELDERVDRYLCGESKAYTWEEAKEIIMKRQPLK